MSARQTKESFMRKVRKTNNCWLWMGSMNENGYGVVGLNGKVLNAHRAAWILFNGEINPKSLFVCHHCDNRRCVRVDHLFLGTAKDNTQDMLKKGRRRGGGRPRRKRCHKGHSLSGYNLLMTSGGRQCRKCRNARNLKYYYIKRKQL